MRTLDFAPLLRSSIGFENLNRLVDFATRGDSDSFPPYNIEKLAEDAYRISMAVAGFARDELELTVQDNVLIVIGKTEKAEEAERQFLHRGIAKRAFERRFQLADTIKVTRPAIATACSTSSSSARCPSTRSRAASRSTAKRSMPSRRCSPRRKARLVNGISRAGPVRRAGPFVVAPVCLRR